MPKLKGIDQKYLFDKQVDKENDTVAYNDEKHLYFSKDDGAPYISVTTLIGKYKQPFNAEFWASYKALESLLDISDFQSVKSTLLSTKQWDDKYLDAFEIDHTTFDAKKAEILQSYEDKKNIACERGTKIHAELEQRFYDLDPTAVAKYAGGGKFSCKKGYYHLDLPKAIYPEFLISHKFDDFLKIAGQIDLLVIDGKDVYIKD